MPLKTILLRTATVTAAACAAAIVLMPLTAFAATATVNGSLNVRSGPGTSYPIIEHLTTGDTVDIGGCRNGWCYLTDREGFVSSSYLRAGNAVVQPNFNLSFNFPQGTFSVGNGGVSIGIGAPPPPPRQDDTGTLPKGGSTDGDVCFYSGSAYTGARFCLDQGQSLAYVGPAWNNRISSIRNPDGYRVTVCNDAGYDQCRTYSTSARSLGSFNNVISSIRVR